MDGPPGAASVRLLLTAEEAFPAFEEAALAARRRIVAGFRIFDPSTKLRSEMGRKIGADWFDLLVHVLRRGVAVDLLLTDFDPIIMPDMHRQTWSNMRKLYAAAEIAGPDARLRVIAGMHPTRAGKLAKIALWPKVHSELKEVLEGLNAMSPERRRAAFRDQPGLRRWLEEGEDEKLRIGRRAAPDLFPVTHHQKLAVIDGETLYVGGLDLNPRRYDTLDHERPGRETWHDIQLIRSGPEAAAAEDHLNTLIEVTEGRCDPPKPDPAFLTTVSACRNNPILRLSPVPVRSEIREELHSQIGAASSFVYLETQFFRDKSVADALVEAAIRAPELELLMILPAAPEVVAFEGRKKLDARYGEYLQAHCVRKVQDAFGDRVYFAAPAQRRSAGPGREGHRDRHYGAPLIYVHAKLCVFDRRAVLVSSANLNGRSLRWDTEAGLMTRDEGFAEHVLSRAIAHWLPETPVDMNASLVEQVRTRARQDAARSPEDREGFLLPYDLDAAEDFGRALPIIPDEMV
ncbi:phospholipase D1/2 [Palleronia aestuarii]|uniref:Phospholipase D n=1 Tax=Palleronia aestuarii TaxID=568105 RepID=A0A2W7NFB7_9RHOB|nr:phospholipase D family protein [Palleronia aestuarii]PZX18898.1 phospholipase D1/2 [Palleronia aestuarii]